LHHHVSRSVLLPLFIALFYIFYIIYIFFILPHLHLSLVFPNDFHRFRRTQ